MAGDRADWTTTHELLAVLIETVDAVSWRPVLPHMKKGTRLPKPTRLPRPGQQPQRRRRRATGAETAAFFAGLQNPLRR